MLIKAYFRLCCVQIGGFLLSHPGATLHDVTHLPCRQVNQRLSYNLDLGILFWDHFARIFQLCATHTCGMLGTEVLIHAWYSYPAYVVPDLGLLSFFFGFTPVLKVREIHPALCEPGSVAG